MNKTKTPTGSQSQPEAASQTQSERFIAKARELGLDEREETFDAALTKVARHRGGTQDAVISEAGFEEGLDKLALKPDREKPVIKGD